MARITEHSILGTPAPKELVTFSYNGTPLTGYAGEPIAVALKAAGVMAHRYTRKQHRPRGIFCAIGQSSIVTEAQPPMFYQMLGTASADFYGHQSKHGSFVFGAHSGYELTNKDNGLPINSSLAASACCRGIMGYFPALKDAKIVRSWAGWIDMCADGVPVISRTEEAPGLILACGFTGHGFGIGPAVGKLLSQMTLGQETAVDLTPLRYDRFRSVV